VDLQGYFRTFYSDISQDDIDLLNRYLKWTSFGKGEHIVVPGQVQRNLYFVHSGVQMSYVETGRKMHVIAFTYPPGICAVPESFLMQQPSRYAIQCLKESMLGYLTFHELQLLFDQSRQLERLFRKLTEAVLSGVLARHMELQACTIEERFRSFCSRSPHLLNLVPHRYLAAYLGIDPTNFSKLFNSVKI
jgi:CRP-like cAMP-binding protein